MKKLVYRGFRPGCTQTKAFRVYVFKLELSKNQVFSCGGSSIKEMFRKLYNQSKSSALSKR